MGPRSWTPPPRPVNLRPPAVGYRPPATPRPPSGARPPSPASRPVSPAGQRSLQPNVQSQQAQLAQKAQQLQQAHLAKKAQEERDKAAQKASSTQAHAAFQTTQVVQTGKKPLPPPQVSTSSSSKEAKLKVSSQQKQEDIGIQTLVGDYAEKGVNHGKRFFQKIQAIPGHENVEVFLYWWDNRDGADFSGWWFGDQLGGTQVWARNPAGTPLPPRVGWKVPWDAPKAEIGLLAVDQIKASTSPPSLDPSSSSPGKNSSDLAATVSKTKQQVDLAEKAADAVLKRGKALLDGTPKDSEIKELQAQLVKQQAALQDAQKKLTTEIGEARKGGAGATTSITDLSNLSPKIRAMQASIVTELNKVKLRLTKPQTPVTQKPLQTPVKIEEEMPMPDLSAALPALEELVTGVEDAVQAISDMTDPLIMDPPEEGEMLDTVFKEVETARGEAEARILQGRKQFAQQLQVTSSLPPEPRKAAVASFLPLQNRINEAQKKLNPFKTFRKDFKSKVEAKRALAQLLDKFHEAELEVEKANMMGMMTEKGQMSEDEVSSTEKAVQAAAAPLTAVTTGVDQKLKFSPGPLKDELLQIKSKALALRKKADEIMGSMRSQRAGLVSQEMVRQATEKVKVAEEVLTACQEAELPFLKGIEVLPAEESKEAISQSESAAMKAEVAVGQARTFLVQKLAEVKRASKDSPAASVLEEIQELQSRAEACSTKLKVFKQDTSSRKVNAELAGVIDTLHQADNKVKAFSEVAQVFSEDIFKVSIEELEVATEKVSALEKDAAAAVAEASKKIIAKQREPGKGRNDSLSKLHARLTTATQELAKQRKAVANSEKLIKGKKVLRQEEDNVMAAEAQVDKVEQATPEEGVEMPDKAIQELGDAIIAAQRGLKSASRSLELHVSSAVLPSLKTAFKTLLDRCKTSQDKLSKVLAGSKTQRDKLLGEAFIREALSKTEAVEAALENVNEAELPFLKGIEILPLEEATSTLAASEQASSELEAAVQVARTFIAATSLEIKSQFSPEKSKTLSEELNKLTARINAASTKLSEFKKSTETRRKLADMQEASEKIAEVERAVEETAKEALPLTKDSIANEDASEAISLCNSVGDKVRETSTLLDAARAFLLARQKAISVEPSLAERLKKLQSRLSESTLGLAKSKKSLTDVEQQFAAQRTLIEAKELVEQLQTGVANAEQACSPLLGGVEDFLVDGSLRNLASTLQASLQEQSLDIEKLFEEAGAESKMLKEDAFVLFLEKLGFASQERCAKIFLHLDKDGDGLLSQSEFLSIFEQRFVSVTSVSVTDVLEVASSKTILKLEPKQILEGLEAPAKDSSTGVLRLKVRALSSGVVGFVSMKGNQGTVYLQPQTLFQQRCCETDKAIEEATAKIQKTNALLASKMKSVSEKSRKVQSEQAKAELASLSLVATEQIQAIQQLKKKVAAAKSEVLLAEVSEKNSHAAAAERKEANTVTSDAAAALAAAGAMLQRLEETTKPLLALKAEESDSFAKPAALHEEAEALKASVTESAAKAKGIAKEQQAKIAKETGKSMLLAKKELQQMVVRADVISAKCTTCISKVQAACKTMVDAKSAEVATALRAEVQKRGISLDAFFAEVSCGAERLSEEVFSQLPVLKPLELGEEHAKLICRQIEAGGIGKRKFTAFLQRYYVVQKAVAITPDFDIGKGKTIRKVDVEEIIEVLEGPRLDEKLSMSRIRGKSLLDSAEGWITVKGNQGTPFLTEAKKPFYTIAGDSQVRLEADDEANEPLDRSLKPGEVLELMEGPRKSNLGNILRARGQVVSDKATGWFTVSKHGSTYAEQNTKLYECTSAAAMTATLEIKSDVVRKLSVGELFIVEEGPTEDPAAGVARIKGRPMTEASKVGWITVQGNAGTVFAQPCTKHYAVLRPTPLQKSFASSSSSIRQLEAGDLLKVSEGPREEGCVPEVRVKLRSTSDGVVGWVVLQEKLVKRWSESYKCLSAQPLHTSSKPEETQVVRQLASAEVLEMLEGPLEESGMLRMKAKAKKDGSIGWTTIRDKSGKLLLSC